MQWQVQEAKQRLSHLLRKAMDEGPQVVTKHGEEIAVVLSTEEYQRLRREANLGFHYALLAAPDMSELDLERPEEWQQLGDPEL